MKNKILFFGYGGLRDPRMMAAILGKDDSNLSGRPAVLQDYRLILQRLDQVPDTIVRGTGVKESAQGLLVIIGMKTF